MTTQLDDADNLIDRAMTDLEEAASLLDTSDRNTFHQRGSKIEVALLLGDNLDVALGKIGAALDFLRSAQTEIGAYEPPEVSK